MNKLDTSHRTIKLDDSFARSIIIDVAAGDQWSSRMKAGPFIFNILPQMVVWLENEEGEYLDTLYITGADFKKIRHAAKNKDGAVFYSECLPYWASRATGAGHRLPSKQNPYPDTLTSATPMADFTLHTSMPESTIPVIIFVELNKSNDSNPEYTEENNHWAGQPSLIYSAKLKSSKAVTLRMTLAGHGGKIDAVPAVYSELSGFDTALNLIESIDIRFE